MQRAQLLSTAIEAALRAGKIQRARYGGTFEIRHKGLIDLVTEVDRLCEEAIKDTIQARCPGHAILAEETGLSRAGGEFLWVVDPLDGTTNFAHGYPCFCASVAVAERGQVVAGVVYDAIKDELYTAERGGGARLNGQPLQVSTSRELLDSLLITGFPYDLHQDVQGKLRIFNHMMGHARAIRRDGSAALDLAYVAAGRADGFWEERLCPWDMAAGILLVEEAGGRATRFDGSPLSGVVHDEIVATNGSLHPALLEVIATVLAAG